MNNWKSSQRGFELFVMRMNSPGIIGENEVLARVIFYLSAKQLL